MTGPCERCGAVQNIEIHHIQHRVNGGKNNPENLKPLCRACHDYQHAKEKIVAALEAEKRRVTILERRLSKLEELNGPELIKEKGYQSYFFESGSELLPPLKGCPNRTLD